MASGQLRRCSPDCHFRVRLNQTSRLVMKVSLGSEEKRKRDFRVGEKERREPLEQPSDFRVGKEVK